MNAPPRLDALLPHQADAPAERARDDDPTEIAEWIESLAAVVEEAGPERARVLLDALQRHAARRGLRCRPAPSTPYVNTIPVVRDRLQSLLPRAHRRLRRPPGLLPAALGARRR